MKKGGNGRDVEAWNATFAQAIVDIGVGVEMCAPRSGNQKGAVERLVGWVKGAFFKHRKFQDDADLDVLDAAEATHVPGTIFLFEERLRTVAGRFDVLSRARFAPGKLTVAAVERALSAPSAQPRGDDRKQLELTSLRAESKGGDLTPEVDLPIVG